MNKTIVVEGARVIDSDGNELELREISRSFNKK
jgi:hypothetical protein